MNFVLFYGMNIWNYYLCDNGYANCDGFLTPYKAVRYHLKDWGPIAEMPQNPKEIFNMRHTRARNVIERAFAVLKMRWAILRSAAFYPVKVQIRLIMACFLLHNFIRSEMTSDPIEQEIDGVEGDEDAEHDDEGIEFVDGVEPSTEWNQKREEMAQVMWDQVCAIAMRIIALKFYACVLQIFPLNYVSVLIFDVSFF